jgi:hypothetical protein
MIWRIIGWVIFAAVIVAVISNPPLLGHWLGSAIAALKSVGDAIAQASG